LKQEQIDMPEFVRDEQADLEMTKPFASLDTHTETPTKAMTRASLPSKNNCSIDLSDLCEFFMHAPTVL
ncbi:hypothetical protein Ciccas_008206, partial [Cichlidogyrus casuarinus]